MKVDSKPIGKSEEDYKYDDPETWILKCQDCDDYVKYEKLHRYHNAKSNRKKGREVRCESCKTKNLKTSPNPEDWKLPCSSCDGFIVYDNFGSFRTVYGLYLKGEKRECPSCNMETRKHIVRKDRVYSRNPTDWVVDCGNPSCDRKKVYKNLKGYQAAMKRIKDGDPALCFSCVSNLLDKTTPEWGDKFRGRIATEETKEKMKETKRNKSPEEKALSSIRHSKAAIKYWESLDDETKQRKIAHFIQYWNDMPEGKREEVRQKTKARIFENGKLVFNSCYNKATIKYIKEILNVKFDTVFQSGETEEYSIQDHKHRKIYFADAYCPRLNVWVEFDEYNKFSYGKLQKQHIERHHRIHELLNCFIIRIWYRKIGNQEHFGVYYDDTRYIGNLENKFKEVMDRLGDVKIYEI